MELPLCFQNKTKCIELAILSNSSYYTITQIAKLKQFVFVQLKFINKFNKNITNLDIF